MIAIWRVAIHSSILSQYSVLEECFEGSLWLDGYFMYCVMSVVFMAVLDFTVH